MLLWAFLLNPGESTAQVVLGLAVVLAALIVAAVTGRVPSAGSVAGARQLKARELDQPTPRLADPDAPGRPRSRAPSQYPTAA
jgi:hypothetical protein